MRTVLGGTFDVLHEGHKRLLDTASSLSDEVLIGLTTNEFAERTRKRKLKPYGERKAALESYLKGRNYRIEPISDPFGPSVSMENLDAIVVSTETLERAHELNALRESMGMKPLVIVVVPLVRDSEGRKISAGRLKR